MPRKTRPNGLTPEQKRIRVMIQAYFAEHRRLQEQKRKLLAEGPVLNKLVTTLAGDPGPSKVDPDAPPLIQFCQELAYFLYLITEMTYEQYCANHDECTPE